MPTSTLPTTAITSSLTSLTNQPSSTSSTPTQPPSTTDEDQDQDQDEPIASDETAEESPSNWYEKPEILAGIGSVPIMLTGLGIFIARKAGAACCKKLAGKR